MISHARFLLEKHRVLRFLLAGSFGAAVNLGLLFALVEWLHVWYVIGAGIAFLGAFFVSFTFQKFWTFKDKEVTGGILPLQLAIYFAIALGNTVINSLMIFLIVEYLHFHYLLAQALSSSLIAVESFLLYRILFKNTPTTPLTNEQHAT